MAESMAWMHEPVRLSRGRLPWFLRWMLEQALHRMFCTLEQGLLMLLELQLQGKLALCQTAPDEQPMPRLSRYRMKSNPTARQGSAGPKAVLTAAEATMQTGERGDDAVSDAGEPQSSAMATAMIRLVPHKAWPRSTSGVWPRLQPDWGDGAMPPSRCKGAKFSSVEWDGRETCVQIVPVIQLFSA